MGTESFSYEKGSDDSTHNGKRAESSGGSRVHEAAQITKRQKIEVHSTRGNKTSKITRSFVQLDSFVTCLAKSPRNDYIITGQSDGKLTFWSRQDAGSEDPSQEALKVTKQYLAHPGKSIVMLIFDVSGFSLATFAKGDQTIRIFDLSTLDMVQIIKLDFVPNTISSQASCWYQQSGKNLIMVSVEGSNNMYVIDPELDSVTKIRQIHKMPVISIIFNSKYACFLSSDEKGLLEVWSAVTYDPPTGLGFKYKSETDLFYFVKKRSQIYSIQWTPDLDGFVCRSSDTATATKFSILTGRLERTYDLMENRSSKLDFIKEETNDFVKEELRQRNTEFDHKGKSVYFCSTDGIRIYDESNGALSDVLSVIDVSSGSISLNQIIFVGNGKIGSLNSEVILSKNKGFESEVRRKPIIVASAVKSKKLFLFQKNEKRDDDNGRVKEGIKELNNSSGVTVIFHTTLGDIKINVNANLVPKTSENFISLCRSKYYDDVIFHRVVKGFMIQTGDPTGTGTGGQSIWGKTFEDEFHDELSHSAPFRVSMANAGVNTNASQFFITTEKAEWLDRKHTVFGEVIDGHDVVKAIERAQTDKNDRPLEQISIISTSVKGM